MPLCFSTCFFLRMFSSEREGLCDLQDLPREQCQGAHSMPCEEGHRGPPLGPTKTAVHAFRWQWNTLTENRDLGIAQTCLHIPALSLNISVASDKWLIHSKPQFLVKWEWALRWENNNCLMGLLQTLSEIVSLAKWQKLWGGKRLFTMDRWAGLSFLLQCSKRSDGARFIELR